MHTRQNMIWKNIKEMRKLAIYAISFTKIMQQ